MNNQLNIPMTLCAIKSSIQIAEKLKNHLNEEISENIKRLMHKKVIFSKGETELQPIKGWGSCLSPLKAINLLKSSEQKTVVGIDSSCIKVAESDDGSVYAGRAAIIFTQNAKLSSYVRIGPIIYYIDDFKASKISFESSGSKDLSKLFLLDSSIAQRVIRERLERVIALELTKILSDSIIMIDGCLKSSKFEERNINLYKVLEIANKNANIIIGLSKTSKIGLLNRLSQILYSSKNLPSYLDVNELVSPFLSCIGGHIFLARFSENGHPYRIDISSPIDLETSLSFLSSSDNFFHGYPESLRLAHHLSTFTSTQCSSIKSYLVKNAGVIEIPSEDLRLATLGSMRFRLS